MRYALLVLFALLAPLVAAERSVVYPFDVTLGGIKAEMKEGKTSRIVVTIAAPDAKPKVDFSKILGFLKKKAE